MNCKYIPKLILVTYLIWLGFLGSTPNSQAQQGIVQERCGRMMPNPRLQFWALDSDKDVQLAVNENAHIRAQNSFSAANSAILSNVNLSHPISVANLGNAQGLAVLQQIIGNSNESSDDVITIYTQTGHILSLVASATTNGLRWARLSAEFEAGKFSIIAYDDETNAYLIDVLWTEESVRTMLPRRLPFLYNPTVAYRRYIYVSPDREYIGYIQRAQSGSGLEFFIYSSSTDRIIWQTPYDGDGLVRMIWAHPNDNELIGIISGATRETRSQLIAISRTGETQVVFDLAEIYGEDVFMADLETVMGNPSTAFWISSPTLYSENDGAKLVALDHTTGHLIDFCVTSIETPLIQDGQYVVFVIEENTPNRPLMILSIDTGDYFQFAGNPLRPVVLINVETSR